MDSLDESCLSSIRGERLENLYDRRQGVRPVPSILINRICPLSLWPDNAFNIAAGDSERFEVHEIRQQPYLEVQKLEICIFDWLWSTAHGLLSRIHQLNSSVRERYCDGYYYGLPGLGYHQ